MDLSELEASRAYKVGAYKMSADPVLKEDHKANLDYMARSGPVWATKDLVSSLP